jgi:hypothetical protein
VAVGVSSVAVVNATSVGTLAEASGDDSVAMGFLAQAIGKWSTAVGGEAGRDSSAANFGNSAFGNGAGRSVTGIYNTAIGAVAAQNVDGDYNIAVGVFAGQFVTGSNNAGLGHDAGKNVAGNSNVAIGQNAGIDITASNTVAIGRNARATENRAVAIGGGSVANVADTVSVGTHTAHRRIVNVAPAVANTDAVTLAQAKALATAAARTAMLSATDSSDIRRELADLRAMVKRQQERIAQFERREAAN